jgi:hypothetical protein
MGNKSRYKVQIDGCEVLRHNEIVSVTNKKRGTIRQLAEYARQPMMLSLETKLSVCHSILLMEQNLRT